MEIIYKLVFDQLRQQTKASENNCCEVALRIDEEVTRICHESRRIQASGEVENWAKTLANHRLKLCFRYYKLGSNRGRIELSSTLSAIVYRYISPSKARSSYQARVTLLEDFLQGFFAEALNAFRREAKLRPDYTPRSRLELAEYMAYAERYAKRRIPLPGHRAQQLIILRAQTFSQKQPSEMSVDMDMAAEGSSASTETDSHSAVLHELRSFMVGQDNAIADIQMYETIIEELIRYLKDRQQEECVQYFVLRLQDLAASEIETVLGLTSRQRDYLQQRFKYHLVRFALSHQWELVHQWLEADLEHNLGLTPYEWQAFMSQLTPQQSQLLKLKQEKAETSDIAKALSLSVAQTEKQWFKLLELAWDIRNRSVS